MSVGQKLTMLKIRSTSVAFLSLRNLEAAPEETMQLRRLINSSNESLGPYLFGKIEFWNFKGPTAEIPGGGGLHEPPPPRVRQYLKKPGSNRVKRSIFQIFWRLHCCAKFLSIELETSNFGDLLIFFIFYDYAKFQKDRTTFIIDI